MLSLFLVSFLVLALYSGGKVTLTASSILSGRKAFFIQQESLHRSLRELHWSFTRLTTWLFPTNPCEGSWITIVDLTSYLWQAGCRGNNNNNWDFHWRCLRVILQFHPYNTRYYCQLPFLFVYYQKLRLGATYTLFLCKDCWLTVGLNEGVND